MEEHGKTAHRPVHPTQHLTRILEAIDNLRSFGEVIVAVWIGARVRTSGFSCRCTRTE